MAAFILYGATGYVGEAAARLAVQSGMRPVLGGRNYEKVSRLAAELGVECRVFDLDDPGAVDRGLKDAGVVLNCAGPYIYTSQPVVEACLRRGAHYLDLTGEIPVYTALAARDAEAKAKGVMLMPGAGFDVVPTDCLAVHLKQRLPSATQLALAFQSVGPGGLPPGTQRTAIEMLAYADRVRRDGQLVVPEPEAATRQVDFGEGPVTAGRLNWGDVFTAYYSTGIPNITVYAALPRAAQRLLALLGWIRPFARSAGVRKLLMRGVKPGPTAEERAKTVVHVWGEVQDAQGRKAAARLHGPEAGLVWTTEAALAAVRRVLAGDAPVGYQTPGKAYGGDFVLECAGVSREDMM